MKRAPSLPLTTGDAEAVGRILKEISDVVSSIDDAEAVMNRVVQFTTDLLRVGVCSLVMVEPDGETLRMGAAHGLPADVPRTYRGRVGEGITGYVAQSGKPLLIEDVEKDARFARKSGAKYSTRSLLSVPLIHETRTIGVLNVNNRNDGGIFTRSDELMLSLVANFVVIAIQKARLRERIRETERFEADVRVAREIQESILPRTLPRMAGWEFAARNLAAREVAGDFYDAIPLPHGGVCMVLGDVCGKGAPAAVYSARVLGYFRAAAQTHHSAAEIVAFVNNLLAPEWTERTFVTAIVAVFEEDGRASFCSAGHQDPLRRTVAGEVRQESAGAGLPLGVSADTPFENTVVLARPDETFVLYTDGVTEAVDAAGDLFRRDRLDKAIQPLQHRSADEVLRAILADVQHFAQGVPQSDDVTVLVARRL